ncbi:hypothetical protein D8847_00190 [Streptococcus mitis]|uniref:Uncharacterized protein n=1 Tax=Streptococcus mitis TaxID=28037 RepID=A0A3R9J3M3_STRMT|nr:hypothetical protein D8847_00190 [Streptococcus mitis]
MTDYAVFIQIDYEFRILDREYMTVIFGKYSIYVVY